MIQWKIENDKFVFFHESSKPFYAWIIGNDPIDSLRYGILKEKVENGLAEVREDKVIITPESLYEGGGENAEIELELLQLIEFLGFPPIYPHKIYVNGKGVLARRDFCYSIDFCKEATPTVVQEHLQYHRRLNLLLDTREAPVFTLTFGQYQVLEHIENFNNLSPLVKKPDYNLEQFAVIRKLSEQHGIILSQTLLNEQVVQPQRLGVDISVNEKDTIDVIPKILDSDLGVGLNVEEVNKGFAKHFRERDKAIKIYTSPGKKEGNSRVRIVISDNQLKILGVIKNRLKGITREELARIIRNPAEVFDPAEDDIDLSELYSDRVIEIGAYKPKVYPFIKEYKSQWFPGFYVEDEINGKGTIEFKNIEEVWAFERAIAEAKNKNSFTVDWEGVSIPIDQAEHILPLIKKQIERLEAPQANKIGEKVLIIKENAEELEYALDHVVSALSLDFEEIQTLPPVPLKDHQKQGVAWLQSLYQQHKTGCLLADEMGLGKTLQILYFLEWVYAKKKGARFLIVAPLGLLVNWQREHEKFFPHSSLKVDYLHRNLDKLKDQLKGDAPSDSFMYLCSYETLRDFQLLICAFPWTIVVLDEAQRIKTPGRMITNAAKALKTDFRIACTGTPVENSFYDLWCIIDFTNPGLLGHARQFGKRFGISPRTSPEKLETMGHELKSLVGPYMLRRIKDEILKDLPPKHYSEGSHQDIHTWFKDLQLELCMPESQRREYEKVKEEGNKLKVTIQNKKIDQRILTVIHKLKCISDHPFLYRDELKSAAGDRIAKDSARMMALIEILKKIQSANEKAIIFAEFRKTQLFIRQILKTLFHIEASIINGDTPAHKDARLSKLSRFEVVEKFNQTHGFSAIIMSPIAAGVGLNVTGANHVIHFSRHWNPAKEEQATDRAHRIGQTKPVFVYYPKAIIEEYDSFDVVLSDLIKSKRRMASAVLYPTEMAEVQPYEVVERIL
jgi:SNF2 family DNA or RNA helicase